MENPCPVKLALGIDRPRHMRSSAGYAENNWSNLRVATDRRKGQSALRAVECGGFERVREVFPYSGRSLKFLREPGMDLPAQGARHGPQTLRTGWLADQRERH